MNELFKVWRHPTPKLVANVRQRVKTNARKGVGKCCRTFARSALGPIAEKLGPIRRWIITSPCFVGENSHCSPWRRSNQTAKRIAIREGEELALRKFIA